MFSRREIALVRIDEDIQSSMLPVAYSGQMIAAWLTTANRNFVSIFSGLHQETYAISQTERLKRNSFRRFAFDNQHNLWGAFCKGSTSYLIYIKRPAWQAYMFNFARPVEFIATEFGKLLLWDKLDNILLECACDGNDDIFLDAKCDLPPCDAIIGAKYFTDDDAWVILTNNGSERKIIQACIKKNSVIELDSYESYVGLFPNETTHSEFVIFDQVKELLIFTTDPRIGYTKISTRTLESAIPRANLRACELISYGLVNNKRFVMLYDADARNDCSYLLDWTKDSPVLIGIFEEKVRFFPVMHNLYLFTKRKCPIRCVEWECGSSLLCAHENSRQLFYLPKYNILSKSPRYTLGVLPKFFPTGRAITLPEIWGQSLSQYKGR